jgi:hypothetical protein
MTRCLLLFDSCGLVFVGGSHSDERTGLSFVRVIVCSNTSFIRIYKVFTYYMLDKIEIHIQYIQGLCQSRFSTADYALFLVASATRDTCTKTRECTQAKYSTNRLRELRRNSKILKNPCLWGLAQENNQNRRPHTCGVFNILMFCLISRRWFVLYLACIP